MNGGLMHRLGKGLLPLGWAAMLAAPLLTHAAITTGRFATLAAVLAMAEVALLTALVVRKRGAWGRAAGGVVAAALIMLLAMRLFRPGWAGPLGLMAASGASHTGIYVSLLLLFGRSLRPGHIDLVSAVALRFRGKLTPAISAYTRNVTKAWCVFFAGQLIVSAALLSVAPHQVWSLFVNVLDGPSVAVMFAAEYAIRRWRFRDERHISPVETFRSFARSRAGS